MYNLCVYHTYVSFLIDKSIIIGSIRYRITHITSFLYLQSYTYKCFYSHNTHIAYLLLHIRHFSHIIEQKQVVWSCIYQKCQLWLNNRIRLINNTFISYINYATATFYNYMCSRYDPYRHYNLYQVYIIINHYTLVHKMHMY